MSGRWELRGSEHARPRPALGSEGGLVLLVSALVPLGLILALAPPPLVLPLFALTAFATAALAALVAWWRGARWHMPGVTLWDLSGALALLGCAAATFARPENVLQLFGYVVAP